ncbi:MAG: hypothetical protein OXT67_09745 [Zetaproteobacteria bacterium]|nr:hypothetical protein [Zetaproteobacteria bacterium]
MILRKQLSIIDNSAIDSEKSTKHHGIDQNAVRDSNLIATTAVLGFCYLNLHQGKPMQFSYNHLHNHDVKGDEEDKNNLQRCVDKLNQVLQHHDRELSAQVTMAETPPWHPGAAITGSFHPSEESFPQRPKPVVTGDQHCVAVAELALEEVATNTDLGVQGKGAYTGLCIHKDGKGASITATAQVIAPQSEHYGQRWIPSQYQYAGKHQYTHEQRPWGMLNDGEEIADMVQHTQPFDQLTRENSSHPYNPDTVAGYVHGMTTAIYNKLKEEEGSPSEAKAVHEIAVGEQTTKLASCLPCALFMYATGFKPSAIHLGRGDSWAPYYADAAPADPLKPREVNDVIAEANQKWMDYVQECFAKGLPLMQTAVKNGWVEKKHAARFQLLQDFVADHPTPPELANLFLDAITVHDKFTGKIMAVFGLNNL